MAKAAPLGGAGRQSRAGQFAGAVVGTPWKVGGEAGCMSVGARLGLGQGVMGILWHGLWVGGGNPMAWLCECGGWGSRGMVVCGGGGDPVAWLCGEGLMGIPWHGWGEDSDA